MALVSYCIASHCIPIISPPRRKRQFYFCCFIPLFPFSSFRAAAAASIQLCPSLLRKKFPLHVTCKHQTQPKTSNNNEIDQKRGPKKEKEKRKRKKKDSITTNEPPFLEEKTLTSHLSHYIHTLQKHRQVQYSQYTVHPSPPYPHHPHSHPQLLNASNYPLFQKSQFVDRQNFPRGSRCVRFSLFFLPFFRDGGGDQGCVGSGQVRSGQVRTVCMYVQYVCKVGRWVGRLMYFAMPCRFWTTY